MHDEFFAFQASDWEKQVGEGEAATGGCWAREGSYGAATNAVPGGDKNGQWCFGTIYFVFIVKIYFIFPWIITFQIHDYILVYEKDLSTFSIEPRCLKL